MNGVVIIDASSFSKSIGELNAILKIETPRLVKECAISVCKAFMKHSYPAVGNDPETGQGGSQAAREQGEYNLQRDIHQMFVPLERYRVADFVHRKDSVVFEMEDPIEWRSKSLEAAWKSENMDALYNAFSKTEESPYAKELKEFPYAPEPTVALQRAVLPFRGKRKIIVKNRQVIDDFAKERMKSIGRSANGWVECVESLGSTLETALLGTGAGRVTVSDGGATVTVENQFGDPNKMITKSGVVDKIITEETYTFAKEIRKALAKKK